MESMFSRKDADMFHLVEYNTPFQTCNFLPNLKLVVLVLCLLESWFASWPQSEPWHEVPLNMTSKLLGLCMNT